MRVTPIGSSLYRDGNEVGRYGRDHNAGKDYFVHYHDGIGGEPIWAMDVGIMNRMSISVDTILVADENNGLFRVDRATWDNSRRRLDGREQCVISAQNDAVTALGDPDDHLRGNLWITPENAHGGYHVDQNEA